MWKRFTNIQVLLHVRAYGHSQSLDDDTHDSRAIRALDHTTLVWSNVSVGCESGPSMRAGNMDAGRSERNAPTLANKQQAIDDIGTKSSETVHKELSCKGVIRSVSEITLHRRTSEFRKPLKRGKTQGGTLLYKSKSIRRAAPI